MSGFAEWLQVKRDEIRAARDYAPPTIIGALASRCAVAEARVTMVRRLHRPDEFGNICLHDQMRWPCPTYVCIDGGPSA